jgi:hypothetical protein
VGHAMALQTSWHLGRALSRLAVKRVWAGGDFELHVQHRLRNYLYDCRQTVAGGWSAETSALILPSLCTQCAAYFCWDVG